jgi:hypothetical protein
LVHRCSVNQRLPVLETHHIPLEHTRRTMLILVRVIAIEESVPEPLLFGLPPFTFKLHTRLRVLPSAPFNARCDGFGLIFHGAPPLLDRTSADCGPSASSPANLNASRTVRLKRKEDARGSKHRALSHFFLLCASYPICSNQLQWFDRASQKLQSDARWRRVVEICRIKYPAKDTLSCSIGLAIQRFPARGGDLVYLVFSACLVCLAR